MSKFYLTTPLYYVNDKPHIGHAYTTILADVLARFYRSMEYDVFFLTGTDEHGQKVQEAAKKRNVDPKSHVDEYVNRFKELWAKLNISHDGFIRTTDIQHTKKVQTLLQSLFKKGDIYLDEYEGLYSVSEERFVTEKEVAEGTFREIKSLKEKNYFFRMSKYQDKLISHIKKHPEFIQPKSRWNEVLGFLKKPLNDLCISRPKSRLNWGIEIPFDKDYVTYVWFDALLNYITAIGWGDNQKNFDYWWPADYHLMAKDILTTHTVYWPTMLMAADIPLPKTIFSHGWWLMEDSKMSKSLGNVIDPMDIIEEFGADAIRYYLMRDMVLGMDSNFTMERFTKRYNSDLANDYGNLVNRVTMLIQKHFEGKIPDSGEYNKDDLELIAITKVTPQNVKRLFSEMKIHDAIENILSLMRKINAYLEIKAPWKSIKDNNEQKSNAATTLALSADVLRICSQLLHPIMPTKTQSIIEILGASNIPICDTTLGSLKAGFILGSGKSPFPRIITK